MIRPMQPGDLGWVAQTWQRTYRKSPAAKLVSGGVYSSEQSWLIDELLKRSTVIIHAAEGDPDTGLAWVCYDMTARIPVAHYAFCVSELRRTGLVRNLLLPLGPSWAYTHWCDIGALVARKLGGTFDPYLISRILLGKAESSTRSSSGQRATQPHHRVGQQAAVGHRAAPPASPAGDGRASGGTERWPAG